jgi:hypothetical protein
MLTERDIRILFATAVYGVLNRPQIQRLCFPTDTTGRVTRRRLQALVAERLLRRHRAQVTYPDATPAGSIYYPSEKGIQWLAEHTGDDRYLLTPTQCPPAHHILHSLAVSDTHIKLDDAIAAQHDVQLAGWINEWDTVNKDETEPDRRYRLYTLLDPNPRLICAPDAAFMLTTAGFSKVFYLEQDRSTTGVHQVAARKIKGFRELAARGLHQNHFTETNVSSFTVLCVAPNDRRRDALRRAFQSSDGAELWKFASAAELTLETFLFAPVWYPVNGEAMPLVNAPVSSES